jgi:hypothetical protein
LPWECFPWEGFAWEGFAWGGFAWEGLGRRGPAPPLRGSACVGIITTRP